MLLVRKDIPSNYPSFSNLDYFRVLHGQIGTFMVFFKQAGNGPSRRHIQVSKIAKGLQNFQVLVNWDYFYEKKIEKSLTMPKKLKGRTLWDFSTSILLQNSKKLKGRTLWDFSTSILLQNSKKIEGGLSWWKKFFLKKVAQCRKNGPFGLVRYCMLLFGSVPWANRYILASSENFVELLVELFWSVQVVLKKHWRKAMTIVDSFLKKSAD